MSVKKHTSTHYTLYNLKALFPPTHTQFTNGFHICSTGSFSLTLAFVIDYVVVREIAFVSGEGLDVIEILWANHRNERFWSSSLARRQWVLSVQGLVRRGQYKLRHLPIVDTGRLFPAEVKKCSLSDQEAWKPDNALSGSQIPFHNSMASCRSIFSEQLPSACVLFAKCKTGLHSKVHCLHSFSLVLQRAGLCLS